MTPWFHRGGLYCAGPNPSFYLGSTVVPMRTFDPELTLDWVERYRLTFLIGAPTNLAMLAGAQSANPRDLSSLRGIVTMGGAPLEREAALRYQQVLTPADLQRLRQHRGILEHLSATRRSPPSTPEPPDVRASTTTSAWSGSTTTDIWRARTRSSHTMVRKSVRSSSGRRNARPPTTTPPQQEKAKYNGSWLHIGDLATWDADEFVTIVGRKDDMLLSGGENVHPVQVEEALNGHPGVVDSLVVGVPDEQWGGSLVVAYVVPADGGGGPDAGGPRRYCRSHPMLSSFKRPRAYRIVESLPPVSATGKKLHYKATESAAREMADGAFRAPAPPDRVHG